MHLVYLYMDTREAITKNQLWRQRRTGARVYLMDAKPHFKVRIIGGVFAIGETVPRPGHHNNTNQRC